MVNSGVAFHGGSQDDYIVLSLAEYVTPGGKDEPSAQTLASAKTGKSISRPAGKTKALMTRQEMSGRICDGESVERHRSFE